MFLFIVLDDVEELSEVRVAVGMPDEGVLEAMGLLDICKPVVEDFRRTDGSRQSAVGDETSDCGTGNIECGHLHDGTWRKQEDLLPNCPAFLMTNRVDLVKDNSKRNGVRCAAKEVGAFHLPFDLRRPDGGEGWRK